MPLIPYPSVTHPEPLFDPFTGEKIPEPKHKTQEECDAEKLAAERAWIAQYMTRPKRTYGMPYFRADGQTARGPNGCDLPWINEETEKQLLREMIINMFKEAGLSLPK